MIFYQHNFIFLYKSTT